jgi:protein-S-isoprenylcysteine O-methyltransferase Ste14
VCRLRLIDLIAQFGEQYREYRRNVSMLLPWQRRLHPE